MRVITITKGGWIDKLPKIQRPVVMHRIANLQYQDNDTWTVRVGGVKYTDGQRP